MTIAENRTCSTSSRSIVVLSLAALAVLPLANGCGRSNVNNSLEEERGEKEGDVADHGPSKDAGFDSQIRTVATGGSYVPPTRAIPDSKIPDTVLDFDASLWDRSDGGPMYCKDNSDCITVNRCEIPVCTASGICSFIPVEEGMPCVNSFGNQICLGGFCQYSSCGDGYLDLNAGEVCDDGNYNSGDDCVNCREATCGDGFLHQDDEECEPDLNTYCNDDCTLGSCGDGVVTSPAENCEPEIDGSACNDVCRLSDEPQWKVEIDDDILGSIYSSMGMFLLLDSAGRPIVVSSGSYQNDDNISIDTLVVATFDTDGEPLWRWTSDEEAAPLIPSMDDNDPILGVYGLGASIDTNDHVVLSGMIRSEELSEMELPWLAKIDADGHLLWSTVVDQDQYGFYGVAVDDQSNIMVMMSTMEFMGTSPFWVITDPSIELFNPDGTYREDESVATTGFFTYRNCLSSGTVGDSSRFMLAGTRENSSGLAAFMALLNSNGELVWDSPIYYADENQDIGFLRALATSDGDIVVLGKTGWDLYSFPYTFWFERYGPDKTARYDERQELQVRPTQNQQIVNGPNGSSFYLPMAVDGDNNVFIAYSLMEDIPGRAVLTIDKYDSDSETVWERPLLYDTGLDDLHSPVDIAVSDQGTIYVLDVSIATDSVGVPDSVGLSLLSWPDPD